MSYIIVYLPTGEQARLFTYFQKSGRFDEIFKSSKDIFDSYEEAKYIIEDYRILSLRGSEYKAQAEVYIDHKNFKNSGSSVPLYLLEVVEVE